VTVEDMAHQHRGGGPGSAHAVIVADLPWLSYHLDPVDTVQNAATFDPPGPGRQARGGGANRVPMIEAWCRPRSRNGPSGADPAVGQRVGGVQGQGRDDAAAHPWPSGPRPSWPHGCFAVGAGGDPEHVARAITDRWRAHHRHRGRAGLRRQVLVLHACSASNARVSPPSSSAATRAGPAGPSRRWAAYAARRPVGGLPADAESLPLERSPVGAVPSPRRLAGRVERCSGAGGGSSSSACPTWGSGSLLSDPEEVSPRWRPYETIGDLRHRCRNEASVNGVLDGRWPR